MEQILFFGGLEKLLKLPYAERDRLLPLLFKLTPAQHALYNGF